MAGSLRASLPPMTTLVLALTLALALRGGALAAGLAKSQRLVGGLLEADGNSEDVRRMLDFAVREYNQMSNDRFLHRPMTLVRARKQVGRVVRSCPGVAAARGRGGGGRGGAREREWSGRGLMRGRGLGRAGPKLGQDGGEGGA